VAWSQPSAIEDYKSLASRGFLASRWLLLNLAVTAAVLVLSVVHLGLLNANVPDSEAILASNDVIAAVSIAEIVIYVIGLVIFLVWFWRAYANGPALGLRDPRFGKGWAIGAWFVPILNLFRPKQIANDAWRAGDPHRPLDSPFWRDDPVSPLLNWWWGVWLLSGFVGNISRRLPYETVEEDKAFTTVAIFSSALWLVAAVLAIAVVRRTTSRRRPARNSCTKVRAGTRRRRRKPRRQPFLTRRVRNTGESRPGFASFSGWSPPARGAPRPGPPTPSPRDVRAR